MKFQKGRSKSGGRKLGIPNRTTETIREIALGLVQDPQYQLSLKRRMISGRSPQLEILMHYYGYGKPKTEISTDKKITVVIQRDGAKPDQVIEVPALAGLSDHEDTDPR